MNQVIETTEISVMTDQETYWQAVQDRDPAYNGLFVYGVRSTGIYCRPTCPSRRPRRDQVTFFTSNADARAAGYRACRRCHPDDPHSDGAQTELIRLACGLIDAAPENPPGLEELAQALHLSPSHFHRLFKKVTGLTPRQYASGQRLQKFKSEVKAGQDVTTALYEAGYSSSSRLYEHAHGSLGMTPGAYRRGGQNMDITYTIVNTRLGRMLVGATQRGISAVSFGDRDSDLETSLRKEYPAASLVKDDSAMKTWVESLVAYLEGTQPNLVLPLDLQATSFQLRVWQSLRQIPYGETRTYAEVAEAIGQPTAVRAVANACASNPAAVVTPCHRVVRPDGGLGGYRWGIERKKALLAQEHSHAGG